MLQSFKTAFKVSELRTKLLYTLGMLFIFRLGAHIPVPGVNPERFADLVNSGVIFGFFDIISGGALRNFSVFAMGIMPYINASIILNLLTVVIPHLDKLKKEGEEGRKKISQYTRYLTVVLAFIQGIGMVVGVSGSLQHPSAITYAITALTITAGTTFLMWMGEQITERGIGNGISLLIFAGIVSRVPQGAARLGEYLNAGTITAFSLILLTVIAALVVAAVVAVQEGQRRIPVRYAKRVVGRRVYGGQTTHLPLKVNQAGVMPIIFASSLLMFPETIIKMFQGSAVANFYGAYLGWGTAAHTMLFALLVIGFTYFYTAVVMNPVDVADNIKKYGGFIPGLRPGRPTAEYISRIMSRVTLSGAIFLALIAVLPNFVLLATKIPNIYFGGTSLLIVVGVALDTMKQIESHLLMRSYQGFIR
ncbi:MAG: preprotein translocase subunit SecY [Peptococcaceae bacterium]|nr:preprotein translocase subunit SecY [Candidatus Syntrophopropionicum ammoniitolerans]